LNRGKFSYEGNGMRARRSITVVAIAVCAALAFGGSGAAAATHGDAMKPDHAMKHGKKHGHAMTPHGAMH
jgi:hypothetical protein